MHGGNIHLIHRETGVPLEKLLDFSANINPLGIPGELVQMMIEAMGEIIHYPDPDYHDLYRETARFFGCEREHLFLGNGAASVIHELIGLLKPKTALLPAPTFSEYQRALERCGTEIMHFTLGPSNRFDLPVAELLDQLAGIDLLVLCNPNNPTGRLIPREDLDKILAECQKQKCHLLVDEAFMDFIFEEEGVSLLSTIDQCTHLTVIRAFTKIFAIPGVRLGAAISGNAGLIRQLRTTSIPWNVNTFAASIQGYLNTREADDFLHATRELVQTERVWLTRELRRFSQLDVIEGRANYLLVLLKPGNGSTEKLRQALITKGIVIRNCSNYKGLGDGWFRTAVKQRSENEVLVNCLREILAETS